MAAYTRPRHEQRVKQYCEGLRIEVFLPCYQSWRRWSDRTKRVEVPLFPSYVFLRMEERERRWAVQAPGFLWFVRTRGGTPVHVAAEELETIRRLLESGLAFDPYPEAQVGDEIEVIAGALRGCRGYLLRKEAGQIVLAIRGVESGVRVHLPDPSWIAPLGIGRRRVEVALAATAN